MGRRPHKCYRKLNKKAYIKSRFCRSGPESKLALNDLGNKKASALAFPARINLINLEDEHISSEALEAARIACNKHLVKNIGKDNFHLRINKQAITVLRINKMMSCAGADRLQAGMRNSFGKPYGRAARVFTGDHVIEIRTKDNFIGHAREALRKASNKLPGGQQIQVSQKHGFTGLYREEFQKLHNERLLLARGATVSVIRPKGPISEFLLKKERALE